MASCFVHQVSESSLKYENQWSIEENKLKSENSKPLYVIFTVVDPNQF